MPLLSSMLTERDHVLEHRSLVGLSSEDRLADGCLLREATNMRGDRGSMLVALYLLLSFLEAA